MKENIYKFPKLKVQTNIVRNSLILYILLYEILNSIENSIRIVILLLKHQQLLDHLVIVVSIELI